MARITIKDVSEPLADHLRASGMSKRGNQYLRAAKILDDAELLDHLLVMNDSGKHGGALDILEKLIGIGKVIAGETVTIDADIQDPEPAREQKPVKFGA